MTLSGFGPYYGMWCEDAPSKWIGAIPTPWVMMFVLGLGVLTPQPKLYHAYGIELFWVTFLCRNIDNRCHDRQQ